MTYRLVDGDPGQPYDKDAAETLSQMLGAHMSRHGGDARVTLEPLGREESLWLYGRYSVIAAYFVIDMEEHLCGSREALLEKLAGRLSVMPVIEVSYDIVWGKAHSLMVYVEGKLAT
jgi:hypothetical protein